MTKKTIIFDTDDESKGHYPSDEAYAPLEIGKVYHVIEDVPSKSITLYPIDISSNLPSMGLGIDGLRINKSEKDVVGPLLVATGSINGAIYKTYIQEDGDIIGDRWGGGSLFDYIQHSIGTAIENSVVGTASGGWTRLQNGLLLQWGAMSGQNNPSGATIFPTAFTKAYSFIAQTHGAVAGTNGVTIACLADDANSLTTQKIKCFQIQTGQVIDAPAWYVKWMAIGY